MSRACQTAEDLLRGVLDRCDGLLSVGRSLVSGVPTRRASLDAADRARVIDSLEGDLDCMVGDAACRAVSLRAARELLLAADVLDWLRGGELPGRGAVDFMEDQVAVMNGAVHPREEELRDAFLAALEELLRSTQEAVAAGRWAARDLNAEFTVARRSRWFGQRLDSTRRSQGLTVGELADRADMDVLNVVAYLVGSEEPGHGALAALGGALSTDPTLLAPPGSHPPDGWSDEKMIGDLPDPGEPYADPFDEQADGEVR